MMDLRDIFNRKIDWESTESPQVLRAVVRGKELRLRFNDFPEEPLCTLIWEGGEQDLNDRGPNWTLPEEREQ
jgi:hypothetical protein